MRRRHLEGEVERVAAVVHADAPACVPALPAPIRAPGARAARVRRAKRLQGDEVRLTDASLGDDLAHRLDARRVLVVVAEWKSAAPPRSGRPRPASPLSPP